MNQPQRILGIDPGFDRCGLGVIETQGNDVRWVAHDCIQTKAGQPLHERLQAIRDGVAAAIKKYQPQGVATEQLFFQTNVTTALTVGMARGVIFLAVADADLPLVEVTPNQVKQGLTGYGSADKKQMQEMVRMILKLPEIPKPDDAADALAIAIVGARLFPRLS